MTNTEKTLAAVYGIINSLPDEDRKAAMKCIENGARPVTNCTPFLLSNLALDLREQLAAECAKESGKSKELAAAKRICSEAKSGAFAVGEKQGMIGAGVYCALIAEPFPALPPMDEKTPGSMADVVNRQMVVARNNCTERLVLPDVGKLKAHIKTEKAEHKGEKRYVPVWDFGEGLPLVNAQYLLNLMELLPGCRAQKEPGKADSTIYFFTDSESGEAVLLPVKKSTYYAARKTV